MTARTAAPLPIGRSVRASTLLVAFLGMVAVCLGGVGLALNDGAATAIDLWWDQSVGVLPGTPSYAFATSLASVGSSVGVGVCVAAAALWLLLRRRPLDAASVALAAIVGVALNELIKALVARPRPLHALLEPPGFSYPSGHSMGAATLVTALLLVALSLRPSQRTKWLLCAAAVAWVVLMMWSRTALHVHWLTDTVAGATIGWSVAVLVRAAVERVGAGRSVAGGHQ